MECMKEVNVVNVRLLAWLATMAIVTPAFAQNPTPRAPTTGATNKQVRPDAPSRTPAPVRRPPPPEVLKGRLPTATKDEKPIKRQKGQADVVKVYRDDKGWKLKVNGEDFMVYGMNWAYIPIGENYEYDLWSKPDDVIKKALDYEFGLMKEMGINAIRDEFNAPGEGMPPKWVTYIYEKYGVMTVVNPVVGRYGYLIDGAYVAPTNYSDPRFRELVKRDIMTSVERYKNVPGVLLWMLGNENNYGLYWSSNEIEDLPQMQQGDARATFLYSLFGEIVDEIHKRDQNHPVAIANGDLGFIDLIKKHIPSLDIMGANMYRGYSMGDAYERVQKELGLPFFATEMGADAYNAKENREDHVAQAEVLRALWQEIYEQSHAKGRVGNAIGGFTFHWSDGWWKYKQQVDLDVHNTIATWSNGAFPYDFVEGQNNVNEEWFGIMAKGRPNPDGLYKLYPRAGYYVLKEGCKLNPYAASTNLETIRRHWSTLSAAELGQPYEVSSLRDMVGNLEMIRSLNLTMEFETFTTDGNLLDDAQRDTGRFDHLESFYLDFQVQPASNVKGSVSINVLGNAPQNPINEIFFEDRALQKSVIGTDGQEVVISDVERIKVYQARVEWQDEWFDLEGFYRSGHFHWGFEGDFFSIYPEANYEPQVDMFNANAPNGFVFTGKKWLEGLKIAAGPELYWGANPTVIAKYYREMGDTKFSIVHQEDITQRASAPTSSVIPVPRTRKTAVYLGHTMGPLTLEIGGLMAGTDRLDRDFTIANQVGSDDCIDNAPGECGGYLGSGYDILDDQIDILDTLGARAKITYVYDNVNVYVQGAYRGLVADSGWDPLTTFTGWSLRETGQGNNYNFLAGTAINFGSFQIAPNFMYQKPLEGPLPFIEDEFDQESGVFFAGVRPRNLLEDPFWVRGSRETIGFELMLSYDPTGATWAWAWDNVVKEDADFAAWVNFVYRVLPTSQDAGVGVSDEGFTFAFSGAPPARNLWEVRGRMIFNPTPSTHIVLNGFGGIKQSTGDDDRLITAGGVDFRLTYRRVNLAGFLKINDWGPYDFQRDFNLTFPVQLLGDVSYSLGTPKWFVRAFTRIGAAFQYRTLNEFSPRFLADPNDPNKLGYEWELRTYVHITL